MVVAQHLPPDVTGPLWEIVSYISGLGMIACAIGFIVLLIRFSLRHVTGDGDISHSVIAWLVAVSLLSCAGSAAHWLLGT